MSSSETPIYETEIHGGGMWSQVIGRGKTLRLTDLEGGANVSMLLYNADQMVERYNMPDTLKGQHVFFLTSPLCVHSDMGRIFCSIVNDTRGWHDTVCGCTDEAQVLEQYGEAMNYQACRNDFVRNGKENFLIELAKWGLGQKDLVPNLNWFSQVVPDEAGNLSLSPENVKAGDSIDLRFEMKTLVVLNTCPHPLDPTTTWAPKPVKLEVFAGEPAAADDPCRLSRPENERAFLNTENYYRLRD
ncbi:MAG: urea carboxylase-associated family protein [Verrucomicrobiae bacterium]|nr:urea carboxylase-associated family protein [Verrucomicrobiae bacterium]